MSGVAWESGRIRERRAMRVRRKYMVAAVIELRGGKRVELADKGFVGGMM